MSASSLLSAAAALVATQSSWTQGANARDVDDNPCPILSDRAVKWDIFGSLVKARMDEGESLADFHTAYGVIRGNIPSGRQNKDIESYNDDIDFADVASMFSE